MLLVCSFISNTYIYITSILLYGFVPFLFFGRKGAIFGCNMWAHNIIGCARYVLGIRYKIEGEVPQGPVILASMHQSAWETAFYYLPRPDSVYVYKKTLAYIPMFNIFLWAAGHICVDRSAGASAIKKLIRDVKSRTGAGRAVVIFPEGTRKKPGEPVDIKPGIIALYKALPDVPIVPVALDSGKFWPRQSRIKYPGTITVRFGKPIEKGLSKEEFIKQLEQGIKL